MNKFNVYNTSKADCIESYLQHAKEIGEIVDVSNLCFVKSIDDAFYIVAYDANEGCYFDAWSDSGTPLTDNLFYGQARDKIKIASS